MKRTLIAAFAATSVAGILAMASPASADHIPTLCGQSSAPDGIVDPTDPSTWNNAGEVISFVAPSQQVGGSADSVGVVASFCLPG